jgi:hypothetical protein
MVMMGTGAVLGAVGMVMALQEGSTSTEVLNTKDHSRSVTEPCLAASDLAELVLMARDPAGHVWPIRLASSTEARIPLPQSPDVPRGVELELVVYRAPRHSGGLYRRGTVLDTFQLP